MTAIEQAQHLQAQAIAILLAERERIDAHLAQLGYGQTPKRGRPRKTQPEAVTTE
jgi:hypothetical protein